MILSYAKARFPPSAVVTAGRDSGKVDLDCSNVLPIAVCFQNRSCLRRFPVLLRLGDDPGKTSIPAPAAFQGTPKHVGLILGGECAN
jgi:hypothetical protein